MNDKQKAELRRLAENIASTRFDSPEAMRMLSWWIGSATPQAVPSLLDENAQLRAEVEALQKDADRWRAARNAIPLCSPYAIWHEGNRPLFGKSADQAMDAFIAMSKGGSTNG